MSVSNSVSLGLFFLEVMQILIVFPLSHHMVVNHKNHHWKNNWLEMEGQYLKQFLSVLEYVSM